MKRISRATQPSAGHWRAPATRARDWFGPDRRRRPHGPTASGPSTVSAVTAADEAAQVSNGAVAHGGIARRAAGDLRRSEARFAPR